MKKKQINDAEREYLIDEILKMPPMVIATAYLHALNYTLYGEDVTKAWTTAVQQQAMLSKAYERGYYEALSHNNIGNDVLDNLRAEIESYEADCILADDSKECKECDKIVFGSIYRIIDRYRNEVSNQDEMS